MIRLLHTSNPFPCPDCGEAFSRRKDLDLHSLIHQGQNPHFPPLPCGNHSPMRFVLSAGTMHSSRKTFASVKSRVSRCPPRPLILGSVLD